VSEPIEVPVEEDVTDEQRVYRAAYAAVMGNHDMTPASRTDNRQVICSCGDTGDVTDMAGHYGEEADRAGLSAVAAMQQ
jgi:hypothetical protein